MSPPTQRNAAAASTPSGAPPVPSRTSTLADDHGAVDVHVLEGLAHRLGGGLIGVVAIAQTDETGRGQGRRFGHPHHLQGQIAIHCRPS
jgi:hypothetical protein